MTSPVRRSSIARTPLRVSTTSKGGRSLTGRSLQADLPSEPAIRVLVAVDRVELLPREGRVLAALDRGADLGHERVIVAKVVDREEPWTERLAALEEVVQVGAAERRAGRAVARRVQRDVREASRPARDPH